MQTLKQKLSSRKFWLSLAAFLASIGTAISGIASENEFVASLGIVLAVISAAIYAAVEAYVDATAVAKSDGE